MPGLEYVPGSTDFTGINMPSPVDFEPVDTGVNGSFLTWTLPGSVTMDAANGAGNSPVLRLEFLVRRAASLDEEGLVHLTKRNRTPLPHPRDLQEL